MVISVSMKTKSIAINFFTSINFDDIDFDEGMIFVWLNGVIVSSIAIPNDEDIDITIWEETDFKSFNSYEEFRKFYYKNLV